MCIRVLIFAYMILIYVLFPGIAFSQTESIYSESPFKDDFFEFETPGTEYNYGMVLDSDISNNQFINELLNKTYAISFRDTPRPCYIRSFGLCNKETSIKVYHEFIYDLLHNAVYESNKLDEIIKDIMQKDNILKFFYKSIIENDSSVGRSEYRGNFEIINSKFNEERNQYTVDQVNWENNKFYLVIADSSKNYDNTSEIIKFNVKNETDSNDSSLVRIVIGDLKYEKEFKNISQVTFLDKMIEKMYENAKNDVTQIAIKRDHLRLILYLLPYISNENDKDRLDYFYIESNDKNKIGSYPVVGIDYYCARFFSAYYQLRLPAEVEFETVGKLRNIRAIRAWYRFFYRWYYLIIPDKYEFVMEIDFPASFSVKATKYGLIPALNANYQWNYVKSISNYYYEVDDPEFRQETVYHLAGNVSEWQMNFFESDPYDTEENHQYRKELIKEKKEIDMLEIKNSNALSTQEQINFLQRNRVVRGGNYKSYLYYLRVQIRNKMNPFTRTSTIGFRCARGE